MKHFLRKYKRLFDPKPKGWDKSLDQQASLIAYRRAIYDGFYAESRDYLTADVSFLIDYLESLEAGTSTEIFRGRLDLDHIATMGHSHGGNVAVEACARDQRVSACIDLDGGAFGWIREQGLEKPLMVIRPAFVNDGTPRGVAQTQLLGSTKADAYEVNIEGANHRSIMDSNFLFSRHKPTNTRPRRVIRITSAYARAFLAKHLSGIDAQLLTSRSPEFPEVSLHTLHFQFPPGNYQRHRRNALAAERR